MAMSFEEKVAAAAKDPYYIDPETVILLHKQKQEELDSLLTPVPQQNQPNLTWYQLGDRRLIQALNNAGIELSPELKARQSQIKELEASLGLHRVEQEQLRLENEIRIAELERINKFSTEEARDYISNQIRQQQQALATQGYNWNTGIPVNEVIENMASRLADSGVKSITDLQIKSVKDENGNYSNRLVNTRTNQPIEPEYAFAGLNQSGGTWGGTFAGKGSTRYNIDFINGVPIFSAQQQATVKSGLEKFAGTALPIALGFALGPAGAGLSNIAAGAIAGGAGGLLKSGDIEDALKGAALGAAGGFAKEALFGAGTAAGDLAKIEASMGTPGLLGSSNILDVINQSGIYTPSVEPAISMIPPTIFNEPVLVPGDSALSSTLAQTPLTVEGISGQLTPSAQALINAGDVGTVASGAPALETFLGQPVGLTRAAWEKLPYDERWSYLNGMVQGNIPKDLSFDLNADGFINSADVDFRVFDNPLPPLVNEPIRVPGDTRLVDTIAQPPLAVENIAGQLTPEAQQLITSNLSQTLSSTPLVVETPAGLLSPEAQNLVTQGLSQTLPVTPPVVETPAGTLSPDTANIINTTAVEGSMTPVTSGDPTRAALYGNEGYGQMSDQTVTGAPISTSPITSLGPAATLKDITDYLTGGAFAGKLGDALKEAFKAATGSGQQQGKGDGLGGLGPIIGGLLSRSPTAAPSAPVTPGRPVDITSPIQSLLAPKLVQQRPVTLL